MKKRIASLLMAVLMLVTMLPVSAMAEGLAAADPAEEQVVSEEVTTEPTEETDETETPEQPEQAGEETQPSEDAELPPEEPVEDELVPLADDTDADTSTVTRIAWVQKLVTAFDMTVEDDNYPDNYYTDIDSNAEYYRDLMVAVEFGVIDLEAGLPFEPEAPATREFAAHTLNYCLGFQLDDSTYTYADTADVTYKDDVQVAVNRGWFALADGSFLPKQAMTTTEAEAMLADAAAVLEGTVVSETYNSTYTFKTGVIEIPDGTDVQVTDGVVRITDCPKTLTSGCTFVVYPNGIPVAYVADTVTTEGNVTVVTATRAEDSDVFESVDAQGVFEADLSRAEALDGGEMTYYVEELDQEFQTYAMAEAAASRLGAAEVQPVYNHDLDLGNGVTLKLNARTSNVKTAFRIDSLKDSVYVSVSGDLTLNYQLKGDIGSALKMSDIHMIYVPVSIGSFTVSLDAEFSGQVSGIQTWHIEAGIQASVNDGVSLIRSVETRSSSLETAATAKFGVQARLGITDLPGVSAYLYAKAGCLAKLKGNTYNDGAAPQKCVHFLMYAYVECGAAGSLTMPLSGIKYKISKKYEIYNQNNSPVRVAHHYEDNALVPSCTRGNVSNWFDGNYGYWRTPANSRYMSSGWSSGFGGNGYDKDGNPVTLYTYTLDDEDNATITAYKGNATAVVIPEKLDGYTVVAIGNEAFRNNTNLRAITIPDSVISIGTGAFTNCKKLSDVTLSAGLSFLGYVAFENCTSLTSITIPKSLKTVDTFYSGPFRNCSALKNVTLEQGISSVPQCLFRDCTGLESIKIPDTVTSIESNAFEGCTQLKNVEIPDSVTSIGNYAFSKCTDLESIVLPNSLAEIKSDAFNGCTALEKIVIPDSVTSIGSGTFTNCKNLSDVKLSAGLSFLGFVAFENCTSLTSITIPKSLKTVDTFYSGPFRNCSALKNVTLEQGISSVPQCLFRDCTGLESIKIPDTVTSIESNAFEGCTQLKNVEIPDSVTSIGNYAFSKCTDLESIVLPNSLAEIKSDAFNGCTALEKIVIPDSVTSIGSGTFTNCKNLSDVKLSAGLSFLGFVAFENCTSLTSITIPKSLKTVDTFYSGPFRNCSALKNVTLEQGISSVPQCLFRDCTGLESIKIPDTVTSIESNAFEGCTQLKNVEIPDSVTEINFSVFKGCTSLEKIVIPDSVTSMENYTFYGCKKLSEVKLPNTRKNIMQSMFQDCVSLKTIILPDTVTTIQSSAFSGCTALETIIFPDSLTSIQGSAFLNCSSLKNVTWGKNLTSIDSSAFSNCDSLTTVILSDSVTKLGTKVFYDCDALTSVKLGSGITTIPVSTFEHCDVLESIVIPRRVTTIGNTAFKDCVKFTSITIPRSVTSISSNAFSYPAKMTIYGVAGTYAETFANDNSIKFVAEEVSATAVTLNTTELTISKGASATLFLTVTPEDFTDAVSWKSSNTSVATISDTGVVKAVGLGTATIKVVVGGESASCKVTVQQPVTGITLNKTSLTLEALETSQLTATVNPSTAVDRRVSWSSSAPEIASVDENGLVTAHKKGSATITVSAMDGSGVTRTCAVTVSNTAYICATVEEMESPHNYPDNCKDFWVYTIPGAEKLLVTFDNRTDIEDGFDDLYAYDADGNQVGKYTGTALAGKTITIPGDTVRLKLVSDGSGNEWGFKVSSITSGMTGGAVSGNVTTGGNAADPVTIALKQDGSTVKTTTVTGGSYQVSGLTDGTYTLEASKPGCVSRSYTVTVKDGEVVGGFDIVLVARGDINGTVSSMGYAVDASDMQCLYEMLTSGTYSGNIEDETYRKAVADINGDGTVDVYDLQRLYEAVSGIKTL